MNPILKFLNTKGIPNALKKYGVFFAIVATNFAFWEGYVDGM